MKIQMFDLHRQYESIKDDIDHAMDSVISRSAFINGPENEQFESAFANYCQTKYAIGLGSGSAALNLVLEALDIKSGDEVICPAHTFAATSEAIAHCGAKPVFVDIDERTFNLDTSLVEKNITRFTKAVIPVHLYGQPAEMSHINDLAQKHNLKVIEDAAQAHGAIYKGNRVGSLADAAIFSFFPAKNLGCFGDGGAVVTNNQQVAEKVRLLKDHGRSSKYHHVQIGYGERLDNLQAAILLAKLPHLDRWNQRRREIAQIYTKLISDQFVKPVVTPHSESVFYVYTLRHKDRSVILERLAEKGISTGIYYPEPLHLQPAFSYLNYHKGSLPVTEKIANEIFSIPISPELTDDEIVYIIKTINASVS